MSSNLHIGLSSLVIILAPTPTVVGQLIQNPKGAVDNLKCSNLSVDPSNAAALLILGNDKQGAKQCFTVTSQLVAAQSV